MTESVIHQEAKGLKTRLMFIQRHAEKALERKSNAAVSWEPTV
jgi:hypothetical protein